MVPRFFLHLVFHEWKFCTLQGKVVFYWNPSSSVYANIRGLRLDCLSKFNVNVNCFSRRQKKCIGYLGSVLNSHAMKWFFQVCIVCSDAFIWCTPIGTNWKPTSRLWLYFLITLDASLSNQWILGLSTLSLRYMWHVVQAFKTPFPVMLLRVSEKFHYWHRNIGWIRSRGLQARQPGPVGRARGAGPPWTAYQCKNP